MLNQNGINVLSLFDGMSCGRIALERANIKIKSYYSSEIDKYAIKVTMKNYPDTIQLGDVTKWKDWKIEKPDLIIAGSPCQGFSFAGKQLNFNDPRSKLFFVFADILKFYKPQYFLLENVRMKENYEKVISRTLGEIYPEYVQHPEIWGEGLLEPYLINSALVSAQNRERLYFTNIPIKGLPEDRGILLKYIIENGSTERNKSYCIDANYFKGSSPENYLDKSRRQLIMGGAFRGRNPDNPSDRTVGIDTEQRLEINPTGKSNCLSTVSKDSLCIQIGNANPEGYERTNRSYSQEGKMPCIRAGDNPKIALPGFESFESEKSQKRIKNNIKELDEKGNCLGTGCGNPAQNGTTVVLDFINEPYESDFQQNKTVSIDKEKFPCLCAQSGGKTRGIGIHNEKLYWRKLTPVECERLQTVDDNYTDCVSTTQRYRMLGNGWTVEVIAWIFSFMKEFII